MTERVFIYPLLLLTVLLGLTLARQGLRWHAGPLCQLALVGLAGLAALLWPAQRWLVVGGWLMFAVFLLVPRWFLGLAWRRLMRRDLGGAAWAWQSAGVLIWGHPGRLYRVYAQALRQRQAGQRAAAEECLERLLASRPPPVVEGAIQAWRLSVLVAERDWPAAMAQYEQTGHWGLLATATQARLLVARAYAELGFIEPALRCLRLVALSPRTLGELARQLASVRICIAALAGDQAETDRLLAQQRRRRGFGRFAATWRGRCALVRGDPTEAQRQFNRALALTPPREKWWRLALAHYTQQAETAPARLAVPAAEPAYQQGQQLLRAAVAQAAPWRDLLEFGPPGKATLGLLASLTAVWLVLTFTAGWGWDEVLLERLANARAELLAGQWWRPLTALWLHTAWWHLLMNGLGLWVFGGAVERVLGGGRFLLLFVVGGTLGNTWSAWISDTWSVSIGASGGVFALLGVYAVLLYRLDLPLYARYRRQFLWLLVVMVGIDLGIGSLESLVDNQAHVGGLVAGLLLGMLLGGQKRGQPRRADL